jgi:hypothetical protein
MDAWKAWLMQAAERPAKTDVYIPFTEIPGRRRREGRRQRARQRY